MRYFNFLGLIVLATSTDGTDDVLETIARREGVLPFRGSLENLSLRFYEAAKHYNIDQIVRITGDDILRDEIMIDKAVEQHLASSCNVTLMKNMPYGTSSEIFSVYVLKTILKTAVVPENTEYLEWYLENDRYFNVNYVESSYQYDPRIRLTLDYEEDFLFFSRVFEHFSSLNPSFILEDVIAYLSENSDVVNINEFKDKKTMAFAGIGNPINFFDLLIEVLFGIRPFGFRFVSVLVPIGAVAL